jgi:hypothetical protein
MINKNTPKCLIDQKFTKGDLVRVAKDLGSSMCHFRSDCEAVVIGSYDDQYGGGDTDSYTLHLKGEGRCSWYHEHQLVLIERGRLDVLSQWEDEKKAEEEVNGNLDWIFQNGKDVLKSAHPSTISTLAKCFGLTNLWGNSGEGFVYYHNAMATLSVAKPFLEAGDQNGWLEYCNNLEG